MMNADWEYAKLENCVEAIIDYRGKTPTKTAFGAPLVTAKIVKGGRIEEATEFIAWEEYDAWMRRGIPRVGDVLVTTEAPLGEVAQITDEKIALAQRIILLRGKTDKLENTFFKYALLDDELQRQLQTRTSGTTVTGIKQSELRKVIVPLPPLPEQRAIARILGSLDDKIELNRRMNATLELLAQTLFRAWFVDFEPVKAKAAGLAPLGLDAETAALFPSEFDDSALRPIPKGWKVENLDAVAQFLNGLALQKFPPLGDETDLPVIKISHLRKGSTDANETANNQIGAAYVIKDGDVLFSWSGSLEVMLWNGGRGALNQHLFKVTSERFPKWFYYFWVLHHLADFRRIAADKATTMGHIQRRHLTEAKVLVPSDELLEYMNGAMDPILALLENNLKQSRTLSQIRDALLPRLISGQLRVPDADAKF